jgi:hypothetical protein
MKVEHATSKHKATRLNKDLKDFISFSIEICTILARYEAKRAHRKQRK